MGDHIDIGHLAGDMVPGRLGMDPVVVDCSCSIPQDLAGAGRSILVDILPVVRPEVRHDTALHRDMSAGGTWVVACRKVVVDRV